MGEEAAISCLSVVACCDKKERLFLFVLYFLGPCTESSKAAILHAMVAAFWFMIVEAAFGDKKMRLFSLFFNWTRLC